MQVKSVTVHRSTLKTYGPITVHELFPRVIKTFL